MPNTPDAFEHTEEKWKDSCIGTAFLQDQCVNKLDGWTDSGFLNRQDVFMSLPKPRNDYLSFWES